MLYEKKIKERRRYRIAVTEEDTVIAVQFYIHSMTCSYLITSTQDWRMFTHPRIKYCIQ